MSQTHYNGLTGCCFSTSRIPEQEWNIYDQRPAADHQRSSSPQDINFAESMLLDICSQAKQSETLTNATRDIDELDFGHYGCQDVFSPSLKLPGGLSKSPYEKSDSNPYVFNFSPLYTTLDKSSFFEMKVEHESPSESPATPQASHKKQKSSEAEAGMAVEDGALEHFDSIKAEEERTTNQSSPRTNTFSFSEAFFQRSQRAVVNKKKKQSAQRLQFNGKKKLKVAPQSPSTGMKVEERSHVCHKKQCRSARTEQKTCHKSQCGTKTCQKKKCASKACGSKGCQTKQCGSNNCEKKSCRNNGCHKQTTSKDEAKPSVPGNTNQSNKNQNESQNSSESNSPNTKKNNQGQKKKGKFQGFCNCKKSRCLKLYCECFRNGAYCTDKCNCEDCMNRECNAVLVNYLREEMVKKNPKSFTSKFKKVKTKTGKVKKVHKRGCNCKRSRCLKAYCECFRAGVKCTDACNCVDCLNCDNPKEKEARRRARMASKTGSSAACPTKKATKKQKQKQSSQTERPTTNSGAESTNEATKEPSKVENYFLVLMPSQEVQLANKMVQGSQANKAAIRVQKAAKNGGRLESGATIGKRNFNNFWDMNWGDLHAETKEEAEESSLDGEFELKDPSPGKPEAPVFESF